jgi:CRP/FNR family cyclic AMP-dependent transcriptional regulator
MHGKTFSPGDIIFRQGDKSEEAYLIVSGKVEISIETPAGPDILTTLDEGEIFGEMGMIDEQPRAATARVLAPTEVQVIDVADFQQEIVRREDRLMRYLDTLFDRLRTTNALLRAHLGERWAEARFASGPPADRFHEVIPTLTILSTETSAGLYPEGLKLKAARFPFRIGRRNDDGCLFSPMDLPLHDQRPFVVSRSHCRIECKGGGYFVRDVGSRSGTIVNGVTIGTEHPTLTAALTPGENSITVGPEGSPHKYWIMIG